MKFKSAGEALEWRWNQMSAERRDREQRAMEYFAKHLCIAAGIDKPDEGATMSEWRSKIPMAYWRVVKDSTAFMRIRFHLEARIFPVGCASMNVPEIWEKFGVIDMDCADEGWGADVADEIVRQHNERIER